MRVLKNYNPKVCHALQPIAVFLQAAAQEAHPPWRHRPAAGALIVEMGANSHRPVDLTAHEAPLDSAPKPVCLERSGELRQRVEALANAAAQAAAATSPVSVTQPLPQPLPAVLPKSRRGLNALGAANIKKIMEERRIPCGVNKQVNVSRLLAHLQKEKRTWVPVVDDAPSPLLAEGYEFPSRDESPVLTHVLSAETVGASVHGGLGDRWGPIEYTPP